MNDCDICHKVVKRRHKEQVFCSQKDVELYQNKKSYKMKTVHVCLECLDNMESVVL